MKYDTLSKSIHKLGVCGMIGSGSDTSLFTPKHPTSTGPVSC